MTKPRAAVLQWTIAAVVWATGGVSLSLLDHHTAGTDWLLQAVGGVVISVLLVFAACLTVLGFTAAGWMTHPATTVAGTVGAMAGAVLGGLIAVGVVFVTGPYSSLEGVLVFGLMCLGTHRGRRFGRRYEGMALREPARQPEDLDEDDGSTLPFRRE